jgi:hypothetical protein
MGPFTEVLVKRCLRLASDMRGPHQPGLLRYSVVIDLLVVGKADERKLRSICRSLQLLARRSARDELREFIRLELHELRVLRDM